MNSALYTFGYNYYKSIHINNYWHQLPVQVAARSRACVCGRSLVGIAGSNPAEGISVYCECCVVLSGRAFCVGLITRPEEFYRLWCVRDRKASTMSRPRATRGCRAMGGGECEMAQLTYIRLLLGNVTAVCTSHLHYTQDVYGSKTYRRR
jgi:hypothetical protein